MSNPQIDVNVTLVGDPLGASTDDRNTSTDITPAKLIGLIKQNNFLLEAVEALLTTPPLPALTATSTKQSDGSQKTQVVDSSGVELGTIANPIIVTDTGGGGGGGAVTVADGADITIGAKTDAKSTATDATAITAMQVWKQQSASIQNLETLTGSVTETAPATDTASSGINGRLQRVAQRVTSLIDLLPAALTGGGGLKVGLVDALPAGTAVIGSLDATGSIGSLTEAAPGTDTASSGLNGRLQRLAQRLTSLIALYPTALTANGGFKIGLVESIPAGENYLGTYGQIELSMAVEKIRDANATPYVAGDQISNATTPFFTFTNIFRVNGGSIDITGIEVITDLKSIVPKMRVGFFNANTATLSADLAPAQELYVDESLRMGYFDMPALATAADATNSTCSRVYYRPNPISLVAAGGSRNLYVDLKTLDAFTPASGQKITVRLFYIQN